MKKIAAALTGTLALTVAAGLLLSDRFSDGDRRRRLAADEADTSSSAASSPKAGEAASRRDDNSGARTVIEGKAMPPMEMLSHYSAWAKTPGRADDRRDLVREIIRQTEPRDAIGLLTMAVVGDATPLEADAMVADVARAMAPLWKDDRMFAEGRDMLRLAETDKGRAVLAASLTERVQRPASGQPEIAQGERHELASDLIQTYMRTKDKALKEQILAQVRAVAGPDVAEVLADPANAHNSLAARKAEQGNSEAAAMLRVGQTP